MSTMWTNPWQKGDVEVETYPAVLDGPRNRWIFIRKIYIIIAIQVLVTVAVANTVVSVHPISSFIVHNGGTGCIRSYHCYSFYRHVFLPCSVFGLIYCFVCFVLISLKKHVQFSVHCIIYTGFVQLIIFSLGFLPLLSGLWLDLHVRLPVVFLLMTSRVNFVWLPCTSEC
jgi:hypothetical protein